jgi:hypothetical protein
MPSSTKTKRGQTTVLPIADIRARADQLRKDVADAVETIGKRAVDILPDSQRKQVDDVLDRINSVAGGVNKTVGSWRSDIEKTFKVVRGTVDKRVTKLRKETQSRSKGVIDGVEKEARRYVERLFKQLKLPVRGDLDSLKRRVSALERRIDELEKTDGRSARSVA